MGESETADYTVIRDGWVAGRWRREGERLALTPAQARYEPLLARAPKPARRRRKRAEG